MTDAPKHRMVDPPEKMEKEAVMSGAAKSIAGDFPASYGTKLPQGIRDMEHHGARPFCPQESMRSQSSPMRS